ncbi:MAG: hypothetical protein Q8P25_05005 [Candidatus Curtissbacteria bacterium]|nr:hypothetical protein [Candidatus Curtissbacteria bacterium]
MAVNAEDSRFSYPAIAEIERDESVVDSQTRASRRLAKIAAVHIKDAGLFYKEPPDKRMQGMLNFFTECIALARVERRNYVGRQIFGSVGALIELLPSSEGELLERVSQNWFEKAFPGRLSRWQRESKKA